MSLDETDTISSAPNRLSPKRLRSSFRPVDLWSLCRSNIWVSKYKLLKLQNGLNQTITQHKHPHQTFGTSATAAASIGRGASSLVATKPSTSSGCRGASLSIAAEALTSPSCDVAAPLPAGELRCQSPSSLSWGLHWLDHRHQQEHARPQQLLSQPVSAIDETKKHKL
jgi:hypothetical protein